MTCPAPILLTRRRFRCGCLTSHTGAGYLAEAKFCDEARVLREELLYLRRRQRRMDLDHPCLPAAAAALVAKEAAITAHRNRAGPAAVPEEERGPVDGPA